ncbi:hypothetical protein NDU88_004720 [Pleurodeles waltl]|uniref:Uncharacterized protein n=1 Tax=Pleurodeles waltl TaxID=8319 RepID=A0AAV7TTD7_PLEWA|nr:hypothetical protein NDU88_004720 [Pleurodeles waltl]
MRSAHPRSSTLLEAHVALPLLISKQRQRSPYYDVVACLTPMPPSGPAFSRSPLRVSRPPGFAGGTCGAPASNPAAVATLLLRCGTCALHILAAALRWRHTWGAHSSPPRSSNANALLTAMLLHA